MRFKNFFDFHKKNNKVTTLQSRPTEPLPEPTGMKPVTYKTKKPFDASNNRSQGLNELILEHLSPFIEDKSVLAPSHYEWLLFKAKNTLNQMNTQSDNSIYGYCADLLKIETLQVEFIHTMKRTNIIDMKHKETMGNTDSELGEEEFNALQMMAFIFLQHRKYDKAGIILKTLHHISPKNKNVRLSLVFVLTEFELIDEADEMLSSIAINNSTIINLIQTKIKLATNKLNFDTTEQQQMNTEEKITEQ